MHNYTTGNWKQPTYLLSGRLKNKPNQKQQPKTPQHPTPPPQYAIAHHSGFAKILSINKSRDTLMLYW